MKTLAYLQMIQGLAYLVLALAFVGLSFGLTQHLNLKELEISGGVCGVVFLPKNQFYGADSLRLSISLGKQLFKNNCATCHHKNMKDNLTGPALGGTQSRWATFPKADLYNWIRNSQALIATKHPRAVSLAAEWDYSVMTAFPNLTDEELESILNYVEAIYERRH